MKRIFAKGSSKEDLMKTLEEITVLTKIDSFLKPGQELVEKKIYENGKLKSWKLLQDVNDLSVNPAAKGKKFNDFTNSLNGLESKQDSMSEDVTLATVLDENENCEPSFSVLSYAGTEPARDWDGKIISHWIIMDIIFPYKINNYLPEFKEITLTLDENIYRMLVQSGIAFMATNGTLYVLNSQALMSIGRIFDCSSIFKSDYEDPLPVALLLTHKLSLIDKLQLITRRTECAGVSIVLGAAGKKFTVISQPEFYKSVMNELAKNCMYDIKEWTVSDELTTVNFSIGGFGVYQKGIIVNTSDLSDTSLSLTTYVEYGNGRIYLSKNKCQHSVAYFKDGIEKLFNNVWNEFNEFDQVAVLLDSMEINYTKTIQKEYEERLQLLIGKKRMPGKLLEPGTYNGFYLFNHLFPIIEEGLQTSRMNTLYDFYGIIFKKLLKNSVLKKRA